MSQIVNLKRRISLEELRTALQQSGCFQLGEKQDWGYVLEYSKDSNAFVNFANGQIEATSPNDALFGDLELLAGLLLCDVVLEDEEAFVDQNESVPTGRVIALYWPFLVIVLGSLLVWRW